MEREDWMKALVQAKRFGNLLNEVQDLSRQMAEAVDRSDPVSMQMLVAMRREPIDKLEEVERAMQELALSIPDAMEGARLAALMGGAEAETPEEKPLADQVASNGRRLRQILELDRVINRKVAREKSVYP